VRASSAAAVATAIQHEQRQQTCKTELAASKTNFAGSYGPGKNAFGVYVSRHSKL